MRDTKLYEQLLGLERPWHVKDVDLQLDVGEVVVRVEAERRLARPVQIVMPQPSGSAGAHRPTRIRKRPHASLRRTWAPAFRRGLSPRCRGCCEGDAHCTRLHTRGVTVHGLKSGL